MRRLATCPEPQSDHCPHEVAISGRFRKYDRFWLPAGNSDRLQFYLFNHFVPHSFRELLMGTLARKLPSLAPSFIPATKEKEFDDLYLLPRVSRNYCPEPSSSVLLTDYQNQSRALVVVFCFTKDEEWPISVLKICPSNSPQAESLREEGAAISRLRKTLPASLKESLPAVLDFAEESDQAVLALEFVRGYSMYFEERNSWSPRVLADRHLRLALQWLTQFQQSTSFSRSKIGSPDCSEAMLSTFNELESRFELDPREEEMLAFVRRLVKRHRDQQVPMVASHGDYWARNILSNDNISYVVDWGSFRTSAMPSTDLLLFMVSYGLSFPWHLGGWTDPVIAFRATMLQRTWLSERFQQGLQDYCRRMDLPFSLFEILVPHFLAAMAIKESKESDNGVNLRRQTWRQLTREYARAGGSVFFG